MSRTRLIPFHKARPVGGRVKVILEPQERLSNIIEVVDTEADKEKYTREWGLIYEIGEGAFSDSSPNPDSDVKVGDLAIFKRYAGQGFPDPSDKTIIYRIMNDTEVWAVVPKEELDAAGYDSSYARAGLKEIKTAIEATR